MKETPQAFRRSRVRRSFPAVIAFLVAVGIASAAQDTAFRLDPQCTTVNFTLGDVLHTVRGTFQLKQGSLRLRHRISGPLSHQANPIRGDHAGISFRPDRVDGTLSLQGKSSVRVHGIFTIHGSDHELTVPAEVEMSSGYLTATLHFAVPYEKWGMKNPSTLFLRVDETVDIDLAASGSVTRP